jgi:phosphonopyruvate decarboxylase
MSRPERTITQELIDQAEHLTGKELYQALRDIFEINYVTGLPCGELREFIATASKEDSESLHLQASNEREAVGIAAGSWLGNKKPVIYMQNSGLFESSNDLGSLLIASKIPTIFVVSWRGAPGENATQHFATGAATKPLLEAFGIPYTDRASKNELAKLKQWQSDHSLPICILQVRERFNQPQKQNSAEAIQRNQTEVIRESSDQWHSREEILEIVAAMTPESRALISSTGLISRSLYHHSDSPNQFYNAGAFGLTSSIGLGFASAKPEIPVTVIEGDGSVLTNLGNLNLIGHYQPQNFLHLVLDNAAYLSCSGETTCGSNLIPEFAALAGYDQVFSITSLTALTELLEYINNHGTNGPTLIQVAINKEGRRSFDRPLGMSEISYRFKQHFTQH